MEGELVDDGGEGEKGGRERREEENGDEGRQRKLENRDRVMDELT